jgi:hypothetical protein
MIAFLIVLCQRKGKLTSGGMFFSWLLFVVCGLPELYWWTSVGMIPTEILSNDLPRYVAFLLWFPCVVIQLVLFSFADSPSDAIRRSAMDQSPEKFSSFLNRSTMWWFNRLCAIGIKKPLDSNDIYGLNWEDKSAALVPRWTQKWDEAMQEYTAEKSIASDPSKIEPPSILYRLFLLFKLDIAEAMTVKLVSDLLQYANPILLK